MTTAETKIVAGLNRFFEDSGVDAVAYRIRQHRFASQVVDLLVDSRHWKYYLAMEVKSISLHKGARAIYFSQHFHQARAGSPSVPPRASLRDARAENAPGNQVDRISDFLKRSGRVGFLAVEMRRGVGRPIEGHLVPWREVESRFRRGEAGFKVDELADFPQIPQRGREYMFTEDFLAEAVGAGPPDAGRGATPVGPAVRAAASGRAPLRPVEAA